MIHGAIPVKLQELHDAPFDFFATGSRAGLSIPTDESDYDFFAEHTGAIVVWLKNHAYNVFSTGYVGDPQIATVYRYEGEISIDVQLVHDVDKKQKVQAVLLKYGTLYGLNKIEARRVWRAMYELLELISY